MITSSGATEPSMMNTWTIATMMVATVRATVKLFTARISVSMTVM
jgi:hypothetical protein